MHTLTRHGIYENWGKSHHTRFQLKTLKNHIHKSFQNNLVFSNIWLNFNLSITFSYFRERHYRSLEKQYNEDNQELKQAVVDHKKFLLKAVQNYCKCLEQGVCLYFVITNIYFTSVCLFVYLFIRLTLY